ncbi:MAG: heme-binding protein [Gammaproteobacteria bacterium]|nr:heme-binding protein [Gammaproteobacteria bacterium]
MIGKLRNTLLASFFLLASAGAAAQDDGAPLINYEQANQAMAAAEAYAIEQGWNVIILITDQNNYPVKVHRLDGAPPRTWDFASAKTQVVNATGVSSGEYLRQVEAGEMEEMETPVRVFTGGVPIFVDGERIGAISASGVTGEQDEEVATAGAEAIGSVSN